MTSSKPTIVVVGAGALGSHAILFLRNLEANIKAIDFDRVEQKNVLSQFHTKMGIGKFKVQALQQTMQLLFGNKLQMVTNKLTQDNVNVLLAEASLVVDCLDNAEARELVQGWVRRTHVPCVHGALAADGAFGRVVWDDCFVIDNEDVRGQATCEGGGHLPFIAIVSSYLAFAVQTFFHDGSHKSFYVAPSGTIVL